MITKKQLKKELDELRSDMAAEFVKRDSQPLNLSLRIKVIEDNFEDLEDAVAGNRDVVRALIKHLHIPAETLKRLIKEVREEYDPNGRKLPFPVEEPELQKEADLFSEPEEVKRPVKEIRREAFERNLISIDALRQKYGTTSGVIRGAVRALGLDTATIEGSPLKYVSRTEIGKISAALSNYEANMEIK